LANSPNLALAKSKKGKINAEVKILVTGKLLFEAHLLPYKVAVVIELIQMVHVILIDTSYEMKWVVKVMPGQVLESIHRR
jgi:hypothetical protein